MISFDIFDELRKLKLKQGLEKPIWLRSRKYVVSFWDIFLENKSLFWINHDTNLLLFDFFPYFQKWHFPYWKRKRRGETPKNFIWAMKQKWLYSLTYKYCTTNIWPNCKISPEYQMDCCLSHKNFVEGHSWKVPKFNENRVTTYQKWLILRLVFLLQGHLLNCKAIRMTMPSLQNSKKQWGRWSPLREN